VSQPSNDRTKGRRRLGSLLLVVATAVAMVVPGASDAKKRPRVGVFGKINGKPFKATNLLGATDPCVFGIYRPSLNQVTISAFECKGKKRRQGTAVKRNYKGLVMSCLRTDPALDTLTPPYTIPCPGSGYVQAKTGRFGIPVSMLEWLSNTAFQPSGGVTSNLTLRVDAVDGANVRGAIIGVFEVVPPGASAPAPINGEVTLNFPFQVR
jgi:hypothetical protein